MTATTSFDARQAQRVKKVLQLVNWAGHRMGGDVPPIVDMPSLRALPQGSLGHAWAKHLDDTGLDPFLKGPRRLQLHDGLHVLTGYGTDPMGEAEVQAFLIGAKFRVVHGILLLGSMRMVHRQRRHKRIPWTAAEVRSRLLSAYAMGRDSRFDPDTWQPETQWRQSLADVQAAFGIRQHCWQQAQSASERVSHRPLTP